MTKPQELRSERGRCPTKARFPKKFVEFGETAFGHTSRGQLRCRQADRNPSGTGCTRISTRRRNARGRSRPSYRTSGDGRPPETNDGGAGSPKVSAELNFGNTEISTENSGNYRLFSSSFDHG